MTSIFSRPQSKRNQSRALARLSSVFALLALVTISVSAHADVMSFKAWKTQRVDEAKVAIQRLQIDAALESASTFEKGGRAPAAPRADRRLEQARLNLEIVSELSTNDYFVLYLKPFKSKDAFLEAAKKLSPEEMGELMVAYQKQLASDASPEPAVAEGRQSQSPRAP